MSSVFSRIRKTCADVAARARWVAIEHDRLQRYAETLDVLGSLPMSHTEEHHLLGRGEDTLIYFVLLDSINFGSGYFPHLEKGRSLSGYFTIAKKLKEYCLAGIPQPADLLRLDAKSCADMFGQDFADPHMQELMELFATAFNQLGRWVVDHYGGDYLGFLKRCGRLEDAVAALLKMPFYRDYTTYRGKKACFLKRAQILLHDLQIAEPGSALLQFGGFEALTVFADNILPFVLQADGILRYDPWLEKRIRAEELIAPGSTEEIELRACSIHAAELLKPRIIEQSRRPITAREIDYCLWNRGQELRKTATLDKPHRTRCVYY